MLTSEHFPWHRPRLQTYKRLSLLMSEKPNANFHNAHFSRSSVSRYTVVVVGERSAADKAQIYYNFLPRFPRQIHISAIPTATHLANEAE